MFIGPVYVSAGQLFVASCHCPSADAGCLGQMNLSQSVPQTAAMIDPIITAILADSSFWPDSYASVEMKMDMVKRMPQSNPTPKICHHEASCGFRANPERHESEELRTSPADLKIQARLHNEFGLINCWQSANPNQPLPQTLRWSSKRNIPYHCDGIFVPKSWADRLQSCEVVSGEL